MFLKNRETWCNGSTGAETESLAKAGKNKKQKQQHTET